MKKVNKNMLALYFYENFAFIYMQSICHYFCKVF